MCPPRRPAPCRRRENKPTISGAPTMTTTAFARVNMPDYKAPFVPYGRFIFGASKKWNGPCTKLHTAGQRNAPFPKEKPPAKRRAAKGVLHYH